MHRNKLFAFSTDFYYESEIIINTKYIVPELDEKGTGCSSYTKEIMLKAVNAAIQGKCLLVGEFVRILRRRLDALPCARGEFKSATRCMTSKNLELGTLHL
jgi:hypothetical protein